ncbi:30S ribosomal protein S11, partial [Candidatus Dojkabacteria bacterium]|nr:30S ribosomal protein S11 [Candidatus Dojkabacteria bacterium]
MAKKATSTKNKKVVSKRKVERGMAMIQASFNNTIVTLTDEEGNALIQGSPAVVGFGGARRSTAFAATKAAQDTAQKAIKKFGLKEVKV